MIRATIQKHFEKEQFLFKKNIKALSLFFIPNVSDFRGENPIVKEIFEEEYKIIRDEVYNKTTDSEYKAYLDKDFTNGKLNVHEGYFSGDKGKNQDDKISKGIDQILNKKEELLSLDTPLRFIFSVWALQEGWDNPNIFNICKIASTTKEISRRQQVGRGLRIAVNQQGKRQTFSYLDENEHDFYDINTLNVFVSHYELDFIKNIQKEISDASFCIVGDVINIEILKDKNLTEREASRFLNLLEDEEVITYSEEAETYHIKSSIYEFINNNADKIKFIDEKRLSEIKEIFKEVKPPVENANKKPVKVKIRQDKLEEFKALWEAINRKSKLVYEDIKQDDLIAHIAKQFNQENIDPTQIKLIEQTYNSHKNQIENNSETILSSQVRFFSSSQYHDFLNSFTQDKKLKLPLRFIAELLSKLDIDKIKNNPKKAKERLKNIIIDNIHDSVLQKIDYQFENEIKVNASSLYEKEINHTLLGRYIAKEAPLDESLFDKIVYDSEIEKAIQINDPMNIDDRKITVFAKLPKISIPTPYKTYNPDFAYLIDRKGEKKLFLIVESKGYDAEANIPKEEQSKIKYAKIFFEKLQQQMPDVEIAYKTRINKQQLSTILTDIEQGIN
jgi:type III restriction enzyme